MKTIDCAVYTRVSVDDEAVQTQEFNTLDNQRESCLAYIKSQQSLGWRFFQEYRDRGKSGGSMDRPALKQMIRDIQAGKIGKVVVYKIDRLSRSHKDFYELLELFENHGVQFVSTTQQFDTGTPAGRLLLHIMMEFAQYEREMIQERTHEKRWAMARKGMWTGGMIPIGYELKEKKLVVNPAEAAIVSKIYELYAENGNLSIVSRKLNQMGYGTRDRVSKTGKKIGGSRWDKKKAARVLQNPVYVGKIRYNHPKNDQEYIYDGQHQPIVTNQELWEKVQKILSKNREIRKSYKQNKYELLFLGLVKCGKCGTLMTNSSKEKDGTLYLYYKCTSVTLEGKEACSVRTVSASQLEAALVGALKKVSLTPALLDKAIAKANRDKSEGIGKLATERRTLLNKHTEVDAEIQNLVKIIGKLADDKKLQSVADRIAELEKTREALKEELTRVQANIDVLERKSVDRETYKRLFDQIGKVFDKLSFQEQRNLILLLVKGVIYTPEHIRIKFWGDLKDVDIFQEIKKLPPDSGGNTPSKHALGGGVTTFRVGVSLDSPGRARTCDLVVTTIPKFPLGLDYLIFLAMARKSGADGAYRRDVLIP